MLNKELKSDLIKKFGLSENDTGSSQVQIALITARIKQIAEHLKLFPKDKHSRLGLVKLVGKRKRFFNYLKRNDKAAHDELKARIKDLM